MEAPVKKRKIQSVLDYAPMQYNETVFKANNPFVGVFEQSPDGRKILIGDKIGDGKSMNPAALERATTKLIDTAAKASVSFKEPSTEMGARIVHGSLILDLWMLTKPPNMVEVGEIEELVSSGDGDELADLVIQTSTMNEDRLSTKSLMNVRHEGDDPEDDEKTHYDFKLLVRDPNVSAGLDDLVTVMVVECSWGSITKRELYQAASCACKAAIENMKKGRYEPVFLEGWGESLWMYGVLFPSAIVTVANGRASNVQSNETVELPTLDKMLSDSTSRMHKNFNTNSSVYPEGDYVAGTLFISRKKFHLPDLKTKGSGVLADCKLFFQALLRVVLGDKVLEWKPEDVDKARRERKQMVKKVLNGYLGK